MKANGISVLSRSVQAELYGMVGRGVSDVRMNEDGEIIFVMSDGREINLGPMPQAAIPPASENTLGGVKIGDCLKIKDGVLSVDTAASVEQDNTKPVTSGAVHMEIGNIEVLLSKV